MDLGSDRSCIGGGNGRPGALLRGGSFIMGPGAGPFAVTAILEPSGSASTVGLRGVR